MQKNLFTVGFLLLFVAAHAQEEKVAQWAFRTSQPQPRAGDQIELIVTAQIDKHWYLYSSDFDPELGPLVTNFSFEENGTFELVGGIQPVEPKKKFDQTWQGEVSYFVKKGEFRQKVRVLKDDFRVTGTIQGQVCSDRQGECLPFSQPFRF